MAFLVGGLLADTKDKKETRTDKDHAAKATITKVDAKAGTITVRMKDENGKDVDRTFQPTEDVRMFDSTDKAVAIDLFQSGNDVLLIEREGRLREVHKNKTSTETKPGEKTPAGTKPPEKKPVEKKPGEKQ
jgi:hypothetical protein